MNIINLLISVIKSNIQDIAKNLTAENDIIIKYNKKNNTMKVYSSNIQRIDKDKTV